ncbi:NAD(P)-binding protein [Tothia fuscella]|uniref:NAD(P)-binding protein n=1 Tax=Tothia fuscella TaxID=1048955 RepID=A0A9P4NV81_9PEZI|nr:NAD(P)-binding protein [Tothia fuscella]
MSFSLSRTATLLSLSVIVFAFLYQQFSKSKMVEIKTVAVLGAGGNVGKAILPVLLNSTLKVTVISRPDSKSSFPSNITVLKSAYDTESLTHALKGQDAVISLVAGPAIASQKTVIDATLAAGVKWFIPSEFGSDTPDQRIVDFLPMGKGKVDVADYLRSKEKEGLSWTGLITGLFFDWGLPRGSFQFDLKSKTGTLWDGGRVRFSATNLPTIGHALVNLLTDPSKQAAAKNKHIYIRSFTTTQSEILSALEKVTGEKWDVKDVPSAPIKDSARKRLAKGDFSAVSDLLKYLAYGDIALGGFEEKAEEGVKLLLPDHKETVVETVRKVVENAKL